MTSHTALGLRRIACVLAACVLMPAAAHAWTWGDTLTTIWKPLPNLPQLARPGDTLSVWASAPAGANGWSALLQYGSYTVAMPPAGGAYVASRARWELGFVVPAGTRWQVYDFVLMSSATAPDTSRHAVKVLPAYRDTFYFAQISDTHLPTHALSMNGMINTADTSGFADFDAVAADLNVIHPEFILHTGDLVNEGELEQYLAMYEMSRAKAALSRLADPVFVVSGNHDLGGWQATAPPDGTSRYNWWRLFGWPYLDSPPAGDPVHSQDYAFDYGLLHCVGLENYINNGSYDHFRTAQYGAQSLSAEQMSWLTTHLATVPAGHTKLLFYHYDFGGTLSNGLPGAMYTQINPVALGVNGAIWGHFHSVPEDTLTHRSAKPFNLGLQSVIDYRAFRIFRVVNGVISPGPMHHSGGIASTPLDSLTVSFTGANDGSATVLGATVTNRFGETWDHGRLVFKMQPGGGYAATGGSVVQQFVHDGITEVEVACVLPAGGVTIVTVTRTAGVDGGPVADDLQLAPPTPNPFVPGLGTLVLRFSQPRRQRVSLVVLDLAGRRVATLKQGDEPAGPMVVQWNGQDRAGRRVRAGSYVIALEAGGARRVAKVIIAN